MTEEIKVTPWASCMTPPLVSGMYQVRTMENPDAILWACWNNPLKRWGAPSNSPDVASKFQFVPWGGAMSEWRAKA